MSFVTRVVAFFRSVEVHRISALVASAAVAVQGVLSGPAVAGLNPADVQIAFAAFVGIASVAREVSNPTVLPFVVAALKKAFTPPRPPMPTGGTPSG